MPPRVLIASHLYPSAMRPHSAPWLAEQVRALAEAGAGLEVLCCSPLEASGEETVRAGGIEIPVHYRGTSAGPLNGTRPGLMLSALRYNGRALAFLNGRRGDFSLVHAHFAFPDGYTMVRLGTEMSVPVIVTLHGSDVTRALARTDAATARIRATLGQAARIVCVSDALAARARELLPGGTAVRMIPNGYDDRGFALRAFGSAATAGADRLDASERDLGFLYVGALRDVKNVQALVEVYLSHPALHSLPLTIVGDGPLRAHLKRLALSAPAPARVTLIGELGRAEVADAMRRARALVLPSLEEGYGVVAAEALACGTPVVASRVGALPEILATEAAGLLVSPGDRSELGEALGRVAEWPHSPADVAAASGARPWRERAGEIMALYDEVVAEARSGGERL